MCVAIENGWKILGVNYYNLFVVVRWLVGCVECGRIEEPVVKSGRRAGGQAGQSADDDACSRGNDSKVVNKIIVIL